MVISGQASAATAASASLERPRAQLQTMGRSRQPEGFEALEVDGREQCLRQRDKDVNAEHVTQRRGRRLQLFAKTDAGPSEVHRNTAASVSAGPRKVRSTRLRSCSGNARKARARSAQAHQRIRKDPLSQKLLTLHSLISTAIWLVVNSRPYL